MQETIADFLKEKKLAIVGASDNKDNFGKYLMVELAKKDYEVFPVNPKYPEVQGKKCVPEVNGGAICLHQKATPHRFFFRFLVINLDHFSESRSQSDLTSSIQIANRN